MISTVAQSLGLNNTADVFKHFWTEYGFPKGEDGATVSIQRMFSDPTRREEMRGQVSKGIRAVLEPAAAKAAVTTSTISAAVPLMYDPEILDLLRSDAPALAQIPQIGWEGPTYKGANISARAHPIGFLSEAESMNVTSLTPSGFTVSPISADMKIAADVVSVGDFAQRTSEHQLSLRDTALGVRVSEYLQLKEQAVLYADPSQAATDKGLGDADAYQGAAKTFTAAGMATDKSAVSLSAADALSKDIKAELKDLCSRYAVSPTDLFVVTSYDVHDQIDNEINVHARTDLNGTDINYGYQGLKIWGVPVVPTHNVKKQTAWSEGGFAPGDEGDVFILNRRAHWFASLAPLFTLPLGRRGASDEFMLAEYGTYVDRSGGKFGKYLKAYAV